ncbi:bacillithiol biosynthesis cysteine-adding enzyme BshC [Candidatus Zixiibacteriota bacterium]
MKRRLNRHATEIMDTTINFDRLPGGSRLFLDFLYDPQRVGAFFPWPFRSDREFASCAGLLDNQEFNRAAIVDILQRQNTEYGADEAALANIKRLGDSRTLTVFTGQQVGLYGGPLYTVFKALGAIGHARLLEEKLERPVVPVFWMAADDHDFAEVRWTGFPGPDNRSQRISYDPVAEPERIPTSQIVFDDRITDVHQSLLAVRMSTEFSSLVDDALAECYRPGVTMAAAFGRWMARVFAGTGLVFFSPADAEAKRLAAGLFERELRSPKCTAQALELVNLRLVESGYHLQVSHPPTHTNLFYFNGQRVPLDVVREGVISDGTTEQSAEKWVELLAREPENFSPGVLMRPVLQNVLFPTIAYIAGPSEVTYWAQARALFEVFGAVQPVVISRPFATLVERKIGKAVDKLNLTLPEVLTDPEGVVNKVAQRSFPAELAERFAKTRECFTEHLAELEKIVASFEPTLEKTFRQGAGKMNLEINSLEKKAFQAHKRKNEIIREQVYKISGHLYPEGKLQERVFGLPYYLNKYGFGLVNYLAEHLRLDTGDHQLIELDM